MRTFVRQRLGVPAFVAGAILALAFAATGGSAEGTNWLLVDLDIVVATALVAAAAFVPWSRLPRSALLVLPLACDIVIAVLRQAQGGTASGYAPLAILPVLWVGVAFGPFAVGLMTAATAAMFGVPILLLGPPLYPETAWRACILWTVVAAIAGGGAGRLMREQRHQTALAAQRARELDRLVATQGAIATADFDLQAVLTTVVEQARRLTGAEAAVVELPDGDEMVYRAVAGTARPHLGFRLAREDSISGTALRLGDVLICRDSETDPRVDAAECRRVGACSIVVVPLSHGGRAAGVLKVYSSTPDALDDHHAQLLSVLASLIAAALVRADLMEQLREQAVTDELTGLLNRRAWYRELDLAFARARRSREPLSLVLLDVDGLKEVNDHEGHGAGDRLLREAAARWQRALREVDLLGRIGGDEFAVVLEGADEAAAAEVVERLDRSLRGHAAASAGSATWDRSETAADLLARADAAMYEQKRTNGLLRRRSA